MNLQYELIASVMTILGFFYKLNKENSNMIEQNHLENKDNFSKVESLILQTKLEHEKDIALIRVELKNEVARLDRELATVKKIMETLEDIKDSE